MDRIIPISDLQSQAKKYVDQVKETDEAVIVTQRGRAAAVLVSYDAYEGYLATQSEMSFPDWKKRLARADKEIAAGEGTPLKAYLKERKGRRP